MVAAFCQETALISFLYMLWRLARVLPLVQEDGAYERGRQIYRLQRTLHLPSELAMEHWAMARSWVAEATVTYYATMHVPSLLLFLLWVWVRHREVYPRWRNTLAITTGFCLFIRFVRVAPPRLLPEYGFVDLPAQLGRDIYGPIGTGASDQFAAMPSIHIAWAAIVGIGIFVLGAAALALARTAPPGAHLLGRHGHRQPLVDGRPGRAGAGGRGVAHRREGARPGRPPTWAWHPTAATPQPLPTRNPRRPRNPCRPRDACRTGRRIAGHHRLIPAQLAWGGWVSGSRSSTRPSACLGEPAPGGTVLRCVVVPGPATEPGLAVVGEGLFELGLGVHHERSVAGHRLTDGRPCSTSTSAGASPATRSTGRSQRTTAPVSVARAWPPTDTPAPSYT